MRVAYIMKIQRLSIEKLILTIWIDYRVGYLIAVGWIQYIWPAN